MISLSSYGPANAENKDFAKKEKTENYMNSLRGTIITLQANIREYNSANIGESDTFRQVIPFYPSLFSPSSALLQGCCNNFSPPLRFFLQAPLSQTSIRLGPFLLLPSPR